jgi:phosphohistidine phosphatase SixA
MILVGHGPDFTQVVGALTGGRLAIRKAGVAQVEIPDLQALKGRLLSLIVPAPIRAEDEPASDTDN